MATILIHPTLACSPTSMARWQHQHRMLIVLTERKAQAIPHPLHNPAAARPSAGWNGGDAA